MRGQPRRQRDGAWQSHVQGLGELHQAVQGGGWERVQAAEQAAGEGRRRGEKRGGKDGGRKAGKSAVGVKDGGAGAGAAATNGGNTISSVASSSSSSSSSGGGGGSSDSIGCSGVACSDSAEPAHSRAGRSRQLHRSHGERRGQRSPPGQGQTQRGLEGERSIRDKVQRALASVLQAKRKVEVVSGSSQLLQWLGAVEGAKAGARFVVALTNASLSAHASASSLSPTLSTAPSLLPSLPALAASLRDLRSIVSNLSFSSASMLLVSEDQTPEPSTASRGNRDPGLASGHRSLTAGLWRLSVSLPDALVQGKKALVLSFTPPRRLASVKDFIEVAAKQLIKAFLDELGNNGGQRGDPHIPLSLLSLAFGLV